MTDSEDDALRGDAPSTHHGRSWHLRLREALIFLWALLATAGVLILAIWMSHNSQTQFSKPSGKRNLIFMVSDGMGPASLSLTRSFRQHIEGLEFGDTLTLDKHFWGSSRTRSSSSLITDSAAGATAFSCGRKSYNGAISMLPDHTPCGTVLEAAKRAGYTTGLVVTTDITDATPACFASHVDVREQNDDIALQEVGEGALGRVVDLMFGGGRCHFLPNGTQGSCRADDIDVVSIAKEKHGFTYVDDRAGFDDFWEGKNDVPLPILGLFAPTDIPFELDRRNMNEIYPSLSEMAKTAIKALEKATAHSDKGFFLMIEGSRIDHAGHINDPAAQVREVLEYDKAFKHVLEFLDESKTPGVLVATSDHETGGLSVARQTSIDYPDYLWYPAVLANASYSSLYLAHKLHQHIAEGKDLSGKMLKAYINEKVVIPGLGILDASDDELTQIAEYPILAQQYFADMVSRRAQIGWSSHGHSAVDVNIYSSGGPGTDAIRGNVENTDVGKFLRDYIGVDVEAITEELQKKMNRKPESTDASTVKVERVGHDHWAVHEDVEEQLEKDGVESS
ncbi:repressible alkaline phosphatase precursor [Truncatella angustata]|uniref:Alkaline phosphatase n=1 Tax=Truncatella angustata TaxID=152316 RepID=A0A9P8ULW5_9PEZI|nr:repressible alkaline phosphatase precursor [Truncatella angustata]KAH6654566.1 repressible alkaline phosphatase precursor [Truncatella angustata]